MLSMRDFAGEFKQCEEPKWQPLLDVAEEIVDEFMWMEELELETGLRLQLYKHRLTRRYIYLDGEGRAWVSRGEKGYRQRYLSVELRCAQQLGAASASRDHTRPGGVPTAPEP
jgi:hypothetical protein